MTSDLTTLCAAVEHSRAIGLAHAFSDWRKREIPGVPRGKRELHDFVRQSIGSYWHPVGTCAMGFHAEAVVDPSLRVHGTTHLRVADASIMPTITSGDTNAPTTVNVLRSEQLEPGRQPLFTGPGSMLCQCPSLLLRVSFGVRTLPSRVVDLPSSVLAV